jgi:CRP-like cAMP-binding protein
VISKGRVRVTKSFSKSKWEVAKFVKYLNRGDFFGENALLE